MTDAELKETVVRTLARIAPEVDISTLRPDVPVRDQIDLDSIDFVNFVIALDEQLGVAVPEADYANVASVDGCVAYLKAHGAAPRAPRG